MARALAPLLIVAGLATGTCARAQGLRDFCADRPGKATPTCILDAGHLQVETGLVDASRQRAGGERDDVYVLGQTELRLGVSRRTELQVVFTPFSVEHTRGAAGRTRRQGVGDLTLGFRTALVEPDGKGRAVSLEGLVTAPTAQEGQGAGGWEGAVRVPLTLPLADGFSLDVAPEVDVRRGGHVAVSAAAAVSHDLAGASVAAELWVEREDLADGHEDHASFDLSAAWMVARDLQLDAGVNAGLTRTTPDIEAYVGVSRRF